MKDIIHICTDRSWFVTLIFCLLLPCQIQAQRMKYKKTKCFQLELIDKEYLLSPGIEQFTINVRITNYCDCSFILYDFKVVGPGSSDIESYHQPNFVAGNYLIVLDRKNKPYSIFRSWPLKVDNVIIPEGDSAARVQSTTRRHAERMMDQKLILKSDSVWQGRLKVKVEPRWYVSGEYSMYLIYDCGRNVTNVVDSSEVKKDEVANNAILFQGYVKSNVVKLMLKE